MKLFTVTLTGADETVRPQDLLELSREFPWVEWGILLSSTAMGRPRYPGHEWLQELYATARPCGLASNMDRSPGSRFAAHLCGETMRRFLTGITIDSYDGGAWLEPHGITEDQFGILFGRTQANFNARREKLDDAHMTRMIEGWLESMDGSLITQHNQANADIWKPIQANERRVSSALHAHQVLHDASGGCGISPEHWPRPIAGVLTGYAGGIGPDNALSVLDQLAEVVGEGYTWIDMESSLRDERDRFDLDQISAMLSQIQKEGSAHGWL